MVSNFLTVQEKTVRCKSGINVGHACSKKPSVNDCNTIEQLMHLALVNMF